MAPLSTLEQWKREIEEWTDLNVVVYHDAIGGKETRKFIREHEWYYKKITYRGTVKRTCNHVFKFNVLVTSYEIISADVKELAEVPWQYMIIDEAHRLKNRANQTLQALKQIKCERRLMLTGTPLQNNTTELWTLLNFLDPTVFPELDSFLLQFGELKTKEQVDALQEIMKPYLLRRMKLDVEKNLPPKEEIIIDVELTNLQKGYYRAIYERNREFLTTSVGGKSLPQLLNVQMQLRKCCNHPFLLPGVEDKETSALALLSARGEALINCSGKLVLIDKLLAKLKSEGRKVLIFSQMVQMLDILQDYLNYRQYRCERIDGRERGNKRQAAIDAFNRDGSEVFVMLLSTRAGGVGINLCTADSAVIFDCDWNPQNDLQAMARCHRIGQRKEVTIYRLITRRTYEAEMFDRAAKKLGLDQAVFGGSMFADAHLSADAAPFGLPAGIDKAEVENLLRNGAYAFLEDNDEAAKVFCESSIDEILMNKTRKHVSVTDGQVDVSVLGAAQPPKQQTLRPRVYRSCVA